MMLKLTGKTQAGKSRIWSHGSVWEVLRTQDSVLFAPGVTGPWAAIKSLSNGNERWVNLAGFDKNFEVEVIEK